MPKWLLAQMTVQKILTVFMFQQSKVYLLLTVGHLVSSSLVVWVLISGYSWLPSHTSHHLLTATVRLTVPTDCPQPDPLAGAGLPVWPPDGPLRLPVRQGGAVHQDRGELHQLHPPRHGHHQGRHRGHHHSSPASAAPRTPARSEGPA